MEESLLEKWQTEYLKWLFGADNSIEANRQAAIIKFDYMPDHLYKYRTFSPNHLEALEKGVLYAAPLDKLNDIREANLVISEKAERQFIQTSYDIMRKQYGLPSASVCNPGDMVKVIDSYFKEQASSRGIGKKIPEELMQSMITEVNDQYRQIMDSYRKSIRNPYSACCFSASNSIFKMWGYYADCYNGFCIEYDFKSLGLDDLKTALLFPVIYVDDNRIIADNIDLIDGRMNMLAATIKNKTDWDYEEEWRLLYPEKESNKPQSMPKPTAIYIGERTDEENTQYMKKFCGNNNIPLFRMIYNQRKDILEPLVIRASRGQIS